MHDDDQEDDETEYQGPAPPPQTETTAGTITATVSREEIVALVAARFFSQMVQRDDGLNQSVRDQLSALVAEKAETAIDKVTEEKVRHVVMLMLADGWPVTDSYGRESKRETVRDRVLAILTQNDRYSGRGENQMMVWVKELFTEAVKKELAPMLEEAKAQLRKLMDQEFAGALRKALMSGAGLRD